MNRYLRLAHELTRYSLSKQQRMAAVVIRGGAVLSTGVNFRFHHAESRALRPHRDYRGSTIYVARHNGRCSRPCDSCQRKIIAAGITRAVYISKAGTVVTERF